MKKNDFSSFTLIAIQAALKAGEILRKGFGTTYEIIAKPGHQNFVTEFDKASEACIISFIKERYPSHNILAEESGFTGRDGKKEILWIIDPLDGTTNFARKLPLFTISIAAYQNEIGLCGVIYQPLTHELFVAEKGNGAYLNGARLSVSQTANIEDCLIVASLPYDIHSVPILNMEQIIKINRRGVTFRNLGSAALALAYVAAGKVDGVWMYNLYPWDLAAGQILIEEAGGLLTRYQNSESSSNILATNHALHSSLGKYLLHV